MNVVISSLNLLGFPTWVATSGPPGGSSPELGSPVGRLGTCIRSWQNENSHTHQKLAFKTYLEFWKQKNIERWFSDITFYGSFLLY